jgi:hypothetical protein
VRFFEIFRDSEGGNDIGIMCIYSVQTECIEKYG